MRGKGVLGNNRVSLRKNPGDLREIALGAVRVSVGPSLALLSLRLSQGDCSGHVRKGFILQPMEFGIFFSEH